jgi:5-methylcytosine-specific restriction enzyme A
MQNTMTHEEYVIQSIRKMGSVAWINQYFNLVKKILTQLDIENDDPRLCLSCTQAGLLPLILGSRYIMHPVSEERIRCIVPSTFTITRQEGRDKGWYFSPNTTRDAKWNELYFRTGDPLPIKIENAILRSCTDILSRSKKSSFRKNHSSFVFDIIMDTNTRNRVNHILNNIDGEWGKTDDIDGNKRTFLLTWNPKAWIWEDFDIMISDVQTKGSKRMSWSCGRSKNIQPDDQFYLMRVGKSKPGIVGFGVVKSHPFTGPHFSEQDKTAQYVDIEFDTLLDVEKEDPVLSLQTLKQEMPDQLWTPQASGTSIKTAYVDKLDKLWFNHLTSHRFTVNPLTIIIPPSRELLEGGKYSVVQTRYERHPLARQICLDAYGYICNICSFDFEEKYGPLGRAFIHVHHIIPVSEKGQSMPTNPEKDLIPVCPNCHAMLHRSRETMHPDTLREIIKNRNQEA